MKQVFLLAVLLFCGWMVKAQPVLTAATNNPVGGDSFIVHTGGADTFDVGPGGPNQTWDFSGINHPWTVPVAFTNVAGGPYGSNLKTGQTSYYIVNDSVYRLVYADYIGSYPQYVYSDYNDYMRYPFTYQSSFVDSFSFFEIHNFSGTNDTVLHYGTKNVVADGYGTLMLPGGVFNNVLRTRRTEEDVAAYSQDDIETDYFTIYEWYQVGRHYPLLTITEQVDIGGPTTYGVSYSTEAFATNVAGTINPNLIMTLSPNPVRDQLTLLTPIAATAQLSITNTLGQTVQSATLTQSKTELPIHLPPGLYYVSLHDATGATATQKLRVE